jgi:hypothetical protein
MVDESIHCVVNNPSNLQQHTVIQSTATHNTQLLTEELSVVEVPVVIVIVPELIVVNYSEVIEAHGAAVLTVGA